MRFFSRIFQKSFIKGIKILLGVSPNIELIESKGFAFHKNIKYPAISLDIEMTGDINNYAKIILYSDIVILMSELMMGEDNIEKRDVNDDDLDAIKEIISTILGQVKVYYDKDNTLPNIAFNIKNVKKISDKLKVDNFSYMDIFKINLNGLSSDILLFLNDFNSNKNIKKIPKEENMSKIIDKVKLPVRVRIGKKKMLLDDALSLKTNKIVELDTLSNSEVEILIGDIVIGMGEVIVIDGNFGVQITSIKEEENGN